MHFDRVRRLTPVRLAFVLMGAVAASCTFASAVAHHPPETASTQPCGIATPQLWAFRALPADTMVAGHRLGGISGIARDPRNGSYLLITDDRGPNGGGRLFRASIVMKPDRTLDVRIEDARTLRQSNGRPFAHEDEPGLGVDAEAVRVAPGGEVFWSSEGIGAKGQGPALFRQRGMGSRSEMITLPPVLNRDPAGAHGPRDNRSFEALDLKPGSDAIWLGLEAPLIEDGPIATTQAGADTSIFELSRAGTLLARYRYRLEPITHQDKGKLADNGLSEILAVSARSMLTLERSGSQQPDGSFKFVTRLFCASQSSRPAGHAAPRQLDKALLVELNRLGPFDTTNFEGMAFGHRLPDGRRSLILVADNDFRPDRPTVIAVLAI